jgi:hypothetical protein
MNTLSLRIASAGLIVGLASSALAQGGYVAATWTGDQIHTLDNNLAHVANFTASGSLPNGIATDGTTIWTAHFIGGIVYGYDMAGTPQFSWLLVNGGTQGMTYVSPAEVGVFGGGQIDFYDPMVGGLIRSIPSAEAGTIEGVTFDGTFLWQLGTNGLYATDVNTGAIINTFPNPAGGCSFGGTGCANSGPNELTLSCTSGNWFKVDKTTGAVTSSGNNGLDMYGLAAIPAPGGGPIGTNYCGPAAANSSGNSGVIGAFGSDVASDNDVRLDATQLATNQFGYFLNSQSQGFVTPPGSQGNLCLSGLIGRYNASIMNSGNAGAISLQLDLTNTPTPNGLVAIQAGETWYFTCWFRDNNPGQTSNFTDGIGITFN